MINASIAADWCQRLSWAAAALVLLFMLSAASVPPTAEAANRDCGDVQGASVRATKGNVDRGTCRSVANRGINKINSGRCGQWNNPSQPSFCKVAKWRCGWPTAGTQSRENLVYFCMIPRSPAALEESYKPDRYRAIIKIGTTR